MELRHSRRAPILQIPSDNIVSIDHPCIIQNVDRAIKSLGGPVAVDEFLDAQLKDKSASIEATMRPDDVLAKGVLSKSLMTDNVLLRITAPMRTGRKRKRGSDEPFTEDPEWQSNAAIPADAKQLLRVLQDNPKEYSVTPIGKISTTHRFRSLLDFQWTTSSNSLVEHMRETLLSGDYTKIKKFKIKPDHATSPGPPMEAPPVFRFTPAPLPYGYRQNMYVKLITDENGVTKLVNIHQSPTHITHAVNADASPDDIPSKSPIPLKPERELEQKIQRIIKRLRVELERRPVMVRRVQVNFSGARGGDEKFAWAYLGYTFREGPFKDALVKFGVDPRSDPKYREYQTFSLQIPEMEKRTRLLRIQGGQKSLGRQDTHIFDGNEWFTDGKVWQVCDMQDPVLRRIIENATVSEEYEPSLCGWYGNGTWCLIRAILRDKIQRLKINQPREDSYYDPFIAAWKDRIDNSNQALTPRDADWDLMNMMSSARGQAMQALKQMQKYRNKKRKERGEELEEEVVIDGVEGADAGASESDEGLEMEDDDSDENDQEDDGKEDEDKDDEDE